jgi:hypothetical protein
LPNEFDFEAAIQLARTGRGDALKNAEARGLRAFVPDRFSGEGKLAFNGSQQGPAERHFREAHEFVRRNQIKQVRTTVAAQFFKLATIAKLILQSAELPYDPAITAVLDGGKIEVVPLREKSFAAAQSRIMNPQVPLENLLPPINRFQASKHLWAAAIIAAEVGPGLFALEDDGVTEGAVAPGAIGGDIGAIATFWKGNFECGQRVAILLRPDQGEPFEFAVGGGFATTALRFLVGRARGRIQRSRLA